MKHDESKICNCQCHNNMYSLIKKAFLALKNENDNYFGDNIQTNNKFREKIYEYNIIEQIIFLL